MVGSTYDEQAIKDSFASCNLDVADDAISTCIAICTEFSLTADELVARWDAYSMNHKVSDAANIDTLQAFRSKMVQEKATKNKENQSSQNLSMSNTSQKRKYPHTTPVIKRDVIKKEGRQDKLEALYNMKSPEGKNNRSFMSPPAPKAQRTNGLFSPS
jgi:hypothetical protein